MTLFPYEPSPQWRRSQVGLNIEKNDELQSTLSDFEYRNNSQVTFQVPESKENEKLPVIKSDNLVIFIHYQSNKPDSFSYFSTSILLPIPLPQILREREKYLKLKQKQKAKKMI